MRPSAKSIGRAEAPLPAVARNGKNASAFGAGGRSLRFCEGERGAFPSPAHCAGIVTAASLFLLFCFGEALTLAEDDQFHPVQGEVQGGHIAFFAVLHDGFAAGCVHLHAEKIRMRSTSSRNLSS